MLFQEIPPSIFLFTALALGLCIGSFFNVLIYRMPLGQSLFWPPSRCPSCSTPIAFWWNIPVLSWVLLAGKCRQCRSSISFQYPLIELITGFSLMGLTYFWLQNQAIISLPLAIAYAYLVIVTIPIIVIDFKHYLIPDAVTYPGILLGIGLSFIPGDLNPLWSLLGSLISGGLLWGVGFAASRVLKKEAMGLGDVKLIAMCGAFFGWQTALLGLALASFFGTVAGISMIAFRLLNQQRHIPFGPFICFGVIIAVPWGASLLNWYWALMSAG